MNDYLNLTDKKENTGAPLDKLAIGANTYVQHPEVCLPTTPTGS